MEEEGGLLQVIGKTLSYNESFLLEGASKNADNESSFPT